MVSAGLLSVSWPIVVLVGAVPAAVLGLTAHLHALRTLAGEANDEDRPRRRPKSRTESRTEDDLIAAAREADARYRAAHEGRPITRDALRVALRVAGPKATELRRHLAAEQAAQTETHDREEAPTTA